MSDKVLWRKITATDMKAITGAAAPSGSGGGAKHIALGVSSRDFPILEFLNVPHCQDVDLRIEPISGLVEETDMEFSCQPERRGGEWRISRQHKDRYPLWTSVHGFPEDLEEYDLENPPVILIARISDRYHARFCMLSEMEGVSSDLKEAIEQSSKNSGIVDFEESMGSMFKLRIPPRTDESRISPIEPTPTAPDTQAPGPPPGPPERTTAKVTRYIRDSRYGKELKALYEYKCCFCDVTLERSHDNPYVESCHIRPLNENGPDEKDNLLILCPNHHVELDYGTISIDPSNFTLSHINSEDELNGKNLSLKHEIDSEYLEYHFSRHRERNLMGY